MAKAKTVRLDGEDWTAEELATLVQRARALVRSPRTVMISEREVIRVVDLKPHWWALLSALDAPYDRKEPNDPALKGWDPLAAAAD